MDELAIAAPGFLIACAFVFGALVGSFLNVVIARVPTGESIVWPPSHCRCCGKAIAPFHNVPILSWFLLRGRCSNCLARFSIRYALVELSFALVCAFAVARHGLALPAFREIVLMGFLLPLAAIDLDTWLLPHALTWPGIGAGLGLCLIADRPSAKWHLLAAAVAFSVMQLVGFIGERILKKEALGQGDAWLMALIGAFLGLKSLLPVVLLSSVQGTLVGVAIIAARRRAAPPDEALQTEPAPVDAPPELPPQEAIDADDEDDWQPDPTAIPFGPFLALAAAEVLYFTALPDLLFPIGALFNG